MDNPHQIIDNQVLLLELRKLQESGARAALFVDDQGLGSENGIITGITEVEGQYRIELEGSRSFPLSKVMAVNGLFRSGFSTC